MQIQVDAYGGIYMYIIYTYRCTFVNIQISTKFFVNRKNWLKLIFKCKLFLLFWKRKFLGVWRVVASKFRLPLEFCWVSSGGKNIVQKLLFWGGLLQNYRYSSVVANESWLVVSGCGWWWWNKGWLREVGVKLWLIVDGRGWSHDTVMLANITSTSKIL